MEANVLATYLHAQGSTPALVYFRLLLLDVCEYAVFFCQSSLIAVAPGLEDVELGVLSHQSLTVLPQESARGMLQYYQPSVPAAPFSALMQFLRLFAIGASTHVTQSDADQTTVPPHQR